MPFVVAGIGLFGTIVRTISSVLMRLRRSDRRKATAWQPERGGEGELWTREDILRNFEAR